MKAKKINKNILITGAGSLIGQGVIKIVRKYSSNHKIIGADYVNKTIGLHWCDKSYYLPDILDKNIKKQKWINSIIKIIKKEKIDMVIPCADFEIKLYSEFKETLKKKFNVEIIVSDYNLVESCNDKFKTVQLLKKHNLDFPKSCLPNKKFFNGKISFPLIVKPRIGSTSKNVYLVKNMEQLKNAIKNCQSPIIQEYLKGDEYTCGVIFLKNKLISVICLRRQLKNGNTSIAFLEKNLILDNYISNVAKIFKQYGPMNFQLKLTKRGPIIFEINPRFSGTTPVREKFGLNEYEAIIRTLFTNKNFSYKLNEGVVIKYLAESYLNFKKFKDIKYL